MLLRLSLLSFLWQTSLSVSSSNKSYKRAAEAFAFPWQQKSAVTPASTLADDRIVVRLGALLPDQIGARRIYTALLDKELREYNTNRKRQRYVFPNTYRIEPVTVFLKSPSSPLDNIQALCDHMIAKNVAAIMYITPWEMYGESTASSQYLIHLTRFTGIPLIAWNADNSGLLYKRKDFVKFRFLQIAHSLQLQVAAMMAVLKYYNWPYFSIVTSHIAGYENFVQECLKYEHEKEFPREVIDVIKLDVKNYNDMYDTFNKAYKFSEARVYLLYATKDEARKIFTMANRVGLTGRNFIWIVTQSVIGTQKERVSPQAQIGMLGIHFNTENSPADMKRSVVYDQLMNLVRIFATALENIVVSGNHSAMNLTSSSSCDNDYDYYWENGGEFYTFLKGVDVPATLDGEPSTFHKIVFDDNGLMKFPHLVVYNLNKRRQWEEIGQFTKDGLSMNDITWPGMATSPPSGLPEKFKLRVVTLDELPFVIVTDVDPVTGKCSGTTSVPCLWTYADRLFENGSSTHENTTVSRCCSGFCIDLLEKLAADLGFEYELFKVADGKWGAKDQETGRWNGLIADIVGEKADICATSLKINSEREQDIAFSVPFYETGISIIVALRRGKLSPTAFLEPFDRNTWILILLLSIQAVAISIFMYEWLSPASYNMRRTPPPGHKFSLFRSYWLVWATLFSASVSQDIPRSHTARFMVLVWAAFSMIFYSIYTANLAAFMITRSEFYDLSGIDDIRLNNPTSENPPFVYGTVESGNTEVTLRKNYRNMYTYINTNGYFKQNVYEGITAVKTGKFDAFLYDAVVLEYYAGKDENCELLTVGKWFSMTGYGFGFPKQSKWLEKVNKLMLKYQQRGDLERMQNFWLTGACSKKTDQSKNHSSPLYIGNFMSAFILLSCGIVACLLFLGVEYVYCNHLRKRMMRLDRAGWFGLLSLSMGRSLSFRQVVERKIAERKHQNLLRSLEAQTQRENDLEQMLFSAFNEISKLQKEREEREVAYTTNPIVSTLRRFSQGLQRRRHGDYYYSPVLASDEKEFRQRAHSAAAMSSSVRRRAAVVREIVERESVL